MMAWAVMIVLAREFAVTGLRLVAVEGGRVIAAALSGKVKTFATMVCICFMLVFDWPWLNILCQAIEEGLSERKLEKDKEVAEETAEGEEPVPLSRSENPAFDPFLFIYW